jgi:hypothetical protein
VWSAEIRRLSTPNFIVSGPTSNYQSQANAQHACVRGE